MNTTATLKPFGLALALILSACSGGGAAPTVPPVLPPPPPVVTAPDFASVTAEIERHPVADMALLIGDADGTLLTYEKGAFSVTDPVRLASGSKWLTGLAVWSLVEAGTLSETDRPADSLGVWSAKDARADITLGQLLSFTSGLDASPSDATCAGSTRFTLRACVAAIHDAGLGSAPGTTFHYGPDHMQVAALMVETITGEALSDTLRRNILDPVGASAETGFFRGDNVRYSGNAVGTAEDYGKVLAGVLDGSLVTDIEAFTAPRTLGTVTGFQPPGLSESGRDWAYAFGFWVECDAVPFNTDCIPNPTLSSAGARGFVPWIDFANGYWAVIAMEEIHQAAASTDLQQILQPMIATALDGR